MLGEGGVEVFADAVEQLRRWQAMGLKTAIVSYQRGVSPPEARLLLAEAENQLREALEKPT